MNKVIIAVAFSALVGCSMLADVAKDKLLGSSNGTELTAQVGKENNKGLVNTKVATSQEVEVGDVQGDSNVGSGNTKNIENDTLTMIGLVLAGMLPPMLLLFYLMPSPRWISRRYKEQVNEKT